ncbi:MAG: LamG domain-containing protein [Planctomycetes bacterium]|nr:LamG domain-containing protein [Planctomycetota bacterium]
MRSGRSLAAIVGLAASLAWFAVASADVESYRKTVTETEGLLDHYTLDADLTDSVDGGNGSNDGRAILPFAPGLGDEGLAAGFGGTGEYLGIARSIQDDFTILAWIKTDTPQIGGDASHFYLGSGLIYADVGGEANDFGAAITGTKFAFGIGNNVQTIHSTSSVTTGDWVHVAAVREVDLGASQSILRIYVNGVLEAEQTHPNIATLDAQRSITIGGNVIDGRYYSGLIDEVALLEVPLDGDAIDALFHEGNDDGVVAYREAVKATGGLLDYYDYEGIYDDTVDGGNGYNNYMTSLPGFTDGFDGLGSSLLTDGIDDVLEIQRPIQDDFTIAAWIWADTPQIGWDGAFFYEGSGLIYADVGGEANDFGTAVTGTKFAFGVGNINLTVTSTSDVTTGDWVHVAAVREVDAGGGVAYLRVYVNGLLEAEEIHTNAQSLTAQPVLAIGGNTIDSRYFLGAIDEVALFATALDDDAIADLYDEGFLNGAEAYREAAEAAPGLVDYFDFEDRFDDIFDGGNGFNSPSSGRVIPAAAPTFVDGIGDGSNAVHFDGNDSFTIDRSIQDDFTIVAWMRTGEAQIGGDAAQFYEGSGFIYADVGGEANDFGTAVTGNKFAFGIGNAVLTIHSTSDVTTDDWVHVAAVREIDPDAIQSHLRIYIDGVLEAESVHTNIQPLTANAAITIGANTIDQRFYRGAIDEISLFARALEDAEIEAIYDSLEGATPVGLFLRGDTDGNGTYTIGDGVQVLERLFSNRAAFTSNCEDTGDLDDNGTLTIGDAVWVFNYLFANGEDPKAPFPTCGPDPNADLWPAAECQYPPAFCP